MVHRSLSGAKMNRRSGVSKDAADKLVRGIKRNTREHYLADAKIRIVVAGLRGEESSSSPERTRTRRLLCGKISNNIT